MEVVLLLFTDECELIVNADKTEKTKFGHLYMGVDQHAWRGTRKLRVSFRRRRGCGPTHPIS